MENPQNIWQMIFLHLKESKINVNSPGMKNGICKEPYVVVKSNGSAKHVGISTMDNLYSVMCYVPVEKYSKLEEYVKEVKRVMKGLEPTVKYDNYETPSYYDESVKAHMISIEYKNYRKK